MKRQLIWDAGPGEMRAGLIEDGSLVEFRIIRQRRDKALLLAREIYTVKITDRIDGSRAFATIGLGEDGVIAPCPHPIGQLVAAEMVRPAIPEPGRWKRAKYRPIDSIAARTQPGWHFSDEPWVVFLREMAPLVEAIICADAATANEVEGDIGSACAIRIDPEVVAGADFEELIDHAVSGEFAIPNGMITIERTRAMTVIDVDGTGDPHAINLSAAQEITRLLRLLDIGGSIAIDFIASANRDQRKAVDAALDPAEHTAVNGYGMAQIIRPRTRLTIPEILCGTTPGRLSGESLAVALLREAGRSQGFGKRRLVARPAIIDIIRQWPEETAALRHSLGAEIELVPDPATTGYGHVHVSQN